MGGGGGGGGLKFDTIMISLQICAYTHIHLHAAQNLPTNKAIGQVIKSMSGILAGVAANHIT